MSRRDRDHVHEMKVISWTYRTEEEIVFDPAVLLACVRGVCDKTEVCRPAPRSRKVPEGLTKYQFDQLKAGVYWPEIVADAGMDRANL